MNRLDELTSEFHNMMLQDKAHHAVETFGCHQTMVVGSLAARIMRRRSSSFSFASGSSCDPLEDCWASVKDSPNFQFEECFSSMNSEESILPRLSGRRHSIQFVPEEVVESSPSHHIAHELPPVTPKAWMKAWTTMPNALQRNPSNTSISSFLEQEYSSMLDEWLDEASEKTEDSLMILSGDEFKTFAIKPQKISSPENTNDVDSSCSQTETNSHFIVAPDSNEASDSFEDSDPTVSSSRHSLRRTSQVMNETPWPTIGCASERFKGAKIDLRLFTFNALDYSADDLAVAAAQIFIEMELDRTLKIPLPSLQVLILSARARMVGNAYHNWTHAVDVLQTVFSLATHSGLMEELWPLERMALFLAALCHDLEHPGVTAGYLVKSQSSLAACYKQDPGLLEKHHSIRAFELLASHEIQLLRGLPTAAQRELTDLVRELILATDMTRHTAFSDAVQARLAANTATTDWDDLCSTRADRLLRMQVLLKCADTSNVLKPFAAAREWAVCVTDEFFAQGDLERAAGLAVTPMCDREAQSRVGLQKGFIDHVAGPFVRRLAGLFPGLACLPGRLEENRRRWDDYSDERLLAEVAEARALRAN